MNLNFKSFFNKKKIAILLALLLFSFPIINLINSIAAKEEATQTNAIDVWVGGSADYYGKAGRNHLYFLGVAGRAAVCLDPSKRLHKGDSGNTTKYYFDPWTSPTNLSRDEGLFLAYAYIMAGGGNGKPMDYGPMYILAQMLCWRIESGPFTIDDFDEWVATTKPIIENHISPTYRKDTLGALENYAENVRRQMKSESVADFMSKWPSEAPVQELKYNEEKGIWENDFELIDYLEAVEVGYDQVWMQYFLDWDKAPAKVGLEGKLKMEHKADGGRNWVHVEFNGDIEELKAVGPIPFRFDPDDQPNGYKNTFSPTAMDIWDPNDGAVQHMFMGVDYTEWTVYMTFGGSKKPDWEPTPGSYEVIVNTHQHDETFISNYNIELYKYDFETGKPLANSEFEILEKMDTSQFDDSVDHNGGNPDGTYPLDDLNFDKFKKIRDNTEKPTDDWQVCGT